MITTQYDSTAIFIAAVEYVADTLFMFTECQAGVMCGRKVYTLHFILVLIPRPFTKWGGYIPERKHQGCQKQGKGKVK